MSKHGRPCPSCRTNPAYNCATDQEYNYLDWYLPGTSRSIDAWWTVCRDWKENGEKKKEREKRDEEEKKRRERADEEDAKRRERADEDDVKRREMAERGAEERRNAAAKQVEDLVQRIRYAVEFSLSDRFANCI